MGLDDENDENRGLEMHLCLEPWYVIFLLFFFCTNDYLQLGYEIDDTTTSSCCHVAATITKGPRDLESLNFYLNNEIFRCSGTYTINNDDRTARWEAREFFLFKEK